jgi:hypothetical protein
MKFDNLVRGDVERFQASLGLKRGADLKMVLLKGHLLLEELLQSYIESRVRYPGLLTQARFTFQQRLVLAGALHPSPDVFGYGWVWQATRRLNTLRNKMVHKLAPDGFAQQVDAFSRSVELHLPFPLAGGEDDPEYRLAKFGMMVSVLGLCLSRVLRVEEGVADGA